MPENPVSREREGEGNGNGKQGERKRERRKKERGDKRDYNSFQTSSHHAYLNGDRAPATHGVYHYVSRLDRS